MRPSPYDSPLADSDEPTRIFRARSMSSLLQTPATQKDVVVDVEQTAPRWLPENITSGRRSYLGLPLSVHLTDSQDIMDDSISTRMTSLRHHMRSSGVAPELEFSSAAEVRRELELFGRALDGIQLPAVVRSHGVSGDMTSKSGRRRMGFDERVEKSEHDLRQIERLAGRMFGRYDPFPKTTREPSFEVLAKVALAEHGSQPEELPKEVVKKGSLAATAMKWAEERRKKIDRELAFENDIDDRVLAAPQDLVSRSQRIRSDIETLSTIRAGRHTHRDYEAAEYYSQLPVDLAVQGIRSYQPEISDVRRKLRAVVCKTKGDPLYYDSRNYEYYLKKE